MRTGYAAHCEWRLHQNSHPTCRQQVRSWSDLLISRGRRRARGDGRANPAAPPTGIEDVIGPKRRPS
jgi:hypothetical protein